MYRSFTVLLIFLTCSKTDLCDLPNFENKWWQIYFAGTPYGDCYNFLDDGHILISDGNTTWPSGQWRAESTECYETIHTDDDYIDVYQNDECLLIVRDDEEYTACGCTYNI